MDYHAAASIVGSSPFVVNNQGSEEQGGFHVFQLTESGVFILKTGDKFCYVGGVVAGIRFKPHGKSDLDKINSTLKQRGVGPGKTVAIEAILLPKQSNECQKAKLSIHR